ncbi:MAG: ATP-binding protein [Candidatus Hodarchaeota archaeon]
MTDDDFNVYRNLQIHLDQFPIGFPATKSGIELKVLRHIFSHEEAYFAIKLNWNYQSLENIYKSLDNEKVSTERLEQILENMIKKGAIKYKIENGKKLYANIPLAVGIYEYQVNKASREFLEDFEEYLITQFGAELLGTKVSQFRTIPIEHSITPKQHVANYDEIRQVIENSPDPIGITNCLCRQGKELLGHPCKKTSLKEACLYFGSTGQLFINEGWARSINKEEVLKILQQAEDDGLVFQSGNSKNPEFICTCCGCCCAILTQLQKVPRPSRIISSNFYAEINSELCVGCGTCVERCQLKSIKLVDNLAKVILKRCIGCGVCVPTCLEGAIELREKEEEIKPPSTKEDLYHQIMEKKQQLRKKEFK